MSNNYKILLVLPFFYPHRGGSQKYAEELFAIMMKNHPNVKVDVLAYNTDKVEKYEEYRGFRVYRIPCYHILKGRFALPKLFPLLRMLKKLSKNNYEFVNTHIRFFDPTWWLWFYAKKIGAKSIFTGHVAVHPVHKSKVVEKISKFVDLTIAKWALKKYDYLTFTNKTAIRFFEKKLGVSKAELYYGGIDTSFFKPSLKNDERSIPKVDVKVPLEKVLVTYVGRLIWSKGITFYYEALKDLKNTDAHKKATFVIAGPGLLEKEIRERVKKDNLQDSVYLTGDLSYEQVRDLLSISDVFINPSNHSEGFPNTVLEGGSSGCYVIATDNAGTWEVIKNGITGALVPQKDPIAFAEAITWAIKNKEKRTEIAQNFRKVLVNKFDWNVISDKFYKNIISKG